MIPDRENAILIWKKYNSSDALMKHALAVEGVMRRFARDMGGDEDLWGVLGILHDVDYETYPDEHCKKCVDILKDEGIDDDFINSVVSHGFGLCSDVEPKSDMEKVLFTIDELTGLINACAIMRPSKSVLDLEIKSLKKKYKDAKFAAGVDRSVIEKGAAMLGLELDDIMERCILGMRDVCDDIGLRGEV